MARTLLCTFIAFGVLGAASVATPVAAEDVVADRIQTQYQAIRVSRVAGGLEYPWGIAFLPDGSYLVTERSGRLQHIRDGKATSIAGLPAIHAHRQGGLLDVALHPDFENSRWVYLSYSKGDADGTTTVLGRGRLVDDRLENFEELFVQDRLSEAGRHYGSRIAWLSDGTLLLSIGDRGAAPARAQDPRDHAGKLLRLNADGTIPADNPFADGERAHPEIFSLGHRNIQGMIVMPGTDQIWVTEHGERGGDELNLVVPGGNYGWPIVTKARDYRTQEQYGEARSRQGYVDPVWEFLPTLAPSGLAVVTGNRFPNWRGDLLAGGLRAERIHRIVIEDGVVVHQEELLLGLVGRIRDVRVGPDGYIYVLSDAEDGALYRIEPFG